MARAKSKIAVGTAASTLTSNPFAGLDSTGLPEGPTPPADQGTPASPSSLGEVILRREKSHRGGKTVVIAGGFEPTISNTKLEEIAKRARQSCGCGGTVRDREIELQGDAPARVRKFFEEEGFRVRGETGSVP